MDQNRTQPRQRVAETSSDATAKHDLKCAGLQAPLLTK